VALYELAVRAKLRPSKESTASILDNDVVVLFEFDLRYNGLPVREYPDTLRLFHGKQVSPTGKTNWRPCASYGSGRSRNAVVAIPTEDSLARTRAFWECITVFLRSYERAGEKNKYR